MTETAPDQKQLATVVRRRLALSESHPVLFDEVGEFSNINYVYRVDVPGRRTFYLKVVPPQPKKLPVPLPRERVLSEAEGIRRFRRFAGTSMVVPDVLFVDAESSSLAMSDVGEARRVLYSVIDDEFDLLTEQAHNLGAGLGAVHSGTANDRGPRPPEEEAIIRNVIFNGLLGPGVKALMPELWPSLNFELQDHRACLIHADLWSKNLLVSKARPVAIVDFEGVCMGDPAFDLGTLAAVALLPALQTPQKVGDALEFVANLLDSWSEAARFTFRRKEVEPRAYRAVSVFLAARGFGPFAYPMSDEARDRVGTLARSLAAEPVSHWNDLAERVIRFGVARSA